MHRRERRKRFRESHRHLATPETRGGHFMDAEAEIFQVAFEALHDGRIAEALTHFEKALQAAPDNPVVHIGIGRTFMRLTRYDDAVSAFRRALALSPNDAEALTDIGAARYRQNRFDEARTALEDAAKLKPDDPENLAHLGNVYRALGELELAADSYARLSEIVPSQLANRCLHASVLSSLGRTEEAIAECEGVIDGNPDFADAYQELSAILLTAGKAREALALCDDFLATRTYDCSLMSVKVLALNETGDPAAARRFGGFDDLVTQIHIAPPAGFASLGEFRQAIIGEAKTHPQFTYDPPEKTTRGGGQTGNLFLESPPAIQRFKDMMAREVRAYIDGLPAASEHPFVAARPSEIGLEGWAVFLREEGYQKPHIHPSGWLSGVYYLKVPDGISVSDPDRRGWIEFGRPVEDYKCRAQPVLEPVCPREGMLVLFPSYLFHRTIPFTAAEERVSLAFDVSDLSVS